MTGTGTQDAGKSRELTLGEWHRSLAGCALAAAAFALVGAGIAVKDPDVRTVGAAAFLAVYALGWVGDLADVRSGRADADPPKAAALLLAGPRGVIFTAALFAVLGVAIGATWGLIAGRGRPTGVLEDVAGGAGWGAAIGASAALAMAGFAWLKRSLRRAVTPRADRPVPPMRWIAGPVSVLAWSTGIAAAAAASLALGVVFVLHMDQRVLAAAAILLVCTVAAAWKRRSAAIAHGELRRFVR